MVHESVSTPDRVTYHPALSAQPMEARTDLDLPPLIDRVGCVFVSSEDSPEKRGKGGRGRWRIEMIIKAQHEWIEFNGTRMDSHVDIVPYLE